MIGNILNLIERHLSWLSLLFLTIGIFWADQSTAFALAIGNMMDSFIDAYSYIAPLAIYLILTPTLTKLYLSESRGKAFAKYTVKWFVVARIIACVYGVLWTAFAFDLPFHTAPTDFLQAIEESFYSLLWMLTHSVYFFAIYASIATVYLVLKRNGLANKVAGGVDLVENLGKYIIPIVPFMMMGIGAYVTILPGIIEGKMGAEFANIDNGIVTILGFGVDVSTSLGMILLYILGALLTGFVSATWHAVLLVMVKRAKPDFSIREYFSVYWVKVYPMLWATSSEALATPLNLHMVKKLCPTIPDEVRQFVVGTGSFLNINGTIINVFIMTGLVATILNIEISLLQLLLSIPIVFLIGYGIPGIPGELILFAGPMALSMGVSPELAPVFLSLFIGLQIGLPDSFRTAANSTDECLCAIILNKKY